MLIRDIPVSSVNVNTVVEIVMGAWRKLYRSEACKEDMYTAITLLHRSISICEDKKTAY